MIINTMIQIKMEIADDGEVMDFLKEKNMTPVDMIPRYNTAFYELIDNVLKNDSGFADYNINVQTAIYDAIEYDSTNN